MQEVIKRKMDELKSICSEHGIEFACAALDSFGDGTFELVFRGADESLVAIAVIILNQVSNDPQLIAELVGSLEYSDKDLMIEENLDGEEIWPTHES